MCNKRLSPTDFAMDGWEELKTPGSQQWQIARQ